MSHVVFWQRVIRRRYEERTGRSLEGWVTAHIGDADFIGLLLALLHDYGHRFARSFLFT